jgi:hypothetical protein
MSDHGRQVVQIAGPAGKLCGSGFAAVGEAASWGQS